MSGLSMSRVLLVALSAASAFFLVACDSSSCGAVGATQACTCATGASGAQTCLAGGAWGACSCAAVDSGVDPNADAGMADAGPADAGPPAPTCSDGAQNQGESDVDCGGPCGGCREGQGCTTATDCTGGVCAGAMCDAPPVVVSRTPVADAEGVEATQVITVQFSEAIDPSTVDDISFRVARTDDFDSSGLAIALPGTIGVSGDTITFTPASPFEEDVSYDVFVASCGPLGEAPSGATLRGCRGMITDLTGNAHAGDQFTFRAWPAAPGAIRLNINGALTRQLFIEGSLNAAMRNSTGDLFTLIHDGGGLYRLRDDAAGVELARGSDALDTGPLPSGVTDARNALFSSTGVQVRIRREEFTGGTASYTILSSTDEYELSRAGDNVQWHLGRSGDPFYIVR